MSDNLEGPLLPALKVAVSIDHDRLHQQLSTRMAVRTLE